MYETLRILFFAVLLTLSFLLLWNSLAKLFSYLKLGKSENRFDRVSDRIKMTLEVALGQSKIFRDKFAGPLHAGIFWGFCVLLFSASEAVIQGFYRPFSWSFLGPLYTLISFSTDLFCLIVFIAVLYAFYRRFVIKVKRLQGDADEIKDAVIVLSSIFIIVTSLMFENAALVKMTSAHAWEFRPLAAVLASVIPISSAGIIFEICWWLHILVILAFMNYLPYSKHLHVYTSVPNVYLGTIGPVNKLKPIDFEKETEKFGVTDFNDLTWKQILDSYTCTHCGRCDSVCPANITGKVLSPRQVVVQIRERTSEFAPVLKKQLNQSETALSEHENSIAEKKFVGDYENIEALWQCTTCGACMKECPVMIEHVPAIVDMRRSLVMMEANFPQELQATFASLENNGTPWAFPQSERADWADGSGVKTASENPDFDILFWVGCAGSFDDRAKKVSLAFAQLLQKAGVNFAILGTEEMCNGDVARRTGNEYLADMLVKSNVETLNRYNVKKIVTACPHCFNTLKNEFPDFGGNYKVYHHSQFLKELISAGKLEMSSKAAAENIAYHDSCYLGRYNDEYSAPREVLNNAGGLKVLEPNRSKDRGLCCGAGGGQMFMEENQGKRVNIERTEELLGLSPNSIAVNCPFCMTMISDGVKAKDRDDVKVKDIAEILLENVK